MTTQASDQPVRSPLDSATPQQGKQMSDIDPMATAERATKGGRLAEVAEVEPVDLDLVGREPRRAYEQRMCQLGRDTELSRQPRAIERRVAPAKPPLAAHSRASISASCAQGRGHRDDATRRITVTSRRMLTYKEKSTGRLCIYQPRSAAVGRVSRSRAPR